ncbi:response regulator transcription factor [Pseudonocardia asaccharolytica]|uniref:DNA-binding response regulator n=1 Tax=Pseudonocardia asaccharolytica DSM 44247 = NBRC 16224 TaxID=1123024 RepID=A0A511D532_9PSEU|nr:response regulator [Pseudonocardia asaccharolytica]GEL19909.1 DNA-binding response regulator [Pseudonocardia asaccharolytica DSM 44247 = NBRC 16224]
MTGPAYPVVLVVDDHELVREVLVATLRAQHIDAHCCTETTVPGIVREAAAHPPGLVLLDLELGRGPHGVPIDGVDAIAMLRAAGWAVLVVSAERRLAQVAAAIAAGAIGQVPKSASFATLFETVLRAVAGTPVMTEQERQTWLGLDRRERAGAARRAALLARLTARERLVLQRLAEGRRAAEIAEESVVSVTTVRSQIRAILAKLEVSSQLGAVALINAGSEG